MGEGASALEGLKRFWCNIMHGGARLAPVVPLWMLQIALASVLPVDGVGERCIIQSQVVGPLFAIGRQLINVAENTLNADVFSELPHTLLPQKILHHVTT